MIFVTVGTHEQPFNRLIEEVDRLKGEGLIEDEVIIQRGYSTYTPKYCKYYDLISYEDMQKYNKEARIVITHGGPASFIDVLALGKTPIIVPRQSKYNEHVNDHQLEFSNALVLRGVNIVVIEDISTLLNAINEVTSKTRSSFVSNNKEFCKTIITSIKKMYYTKEEES